MIFLLIFAFIRFSDCSVRKYTIEQVLDHSKHVPSNYSVETFNQTYFVIDDHFSKPAAPVLLVFGPAGPADPETLIYATIVSDVARQLSALIVLVENRYYGSSVRSEMFSDDMLHYLTVEQTLADAVAVQNKVKIDLSLKLNLWISFGASYGGILSILYRQKYSHLVQLSVSSSAPIYLDNNGILYYNSIAWSLKNESMGGSAQCLKQIAVAFETFDGVLQLNNVQRLKKDFLLCDETQLMSEKDRFVLAYDMSSMIVDIVANNELQNKRGLSIKSHLCPIFVKNSEAYEALKELRMQNLKSKNQTCSNETWESFIVGKTQEEVDNWETHQEKSGQRAWWWQVCSEFGFVNYCDFSTGCPLSRFLDRSGFEALCREVFGIDPAQSRKANEMFKLKYIGTGLGVGEIIAVNGGADPWSMYGVTSSDSNKHIAPYLIPEFGERPDYRLKQANTEYESLGRVRNEVAEKVEQLLYKVHKNRAVRHVEHLFLIFALVDWFLG